MSAQTTPVPAFEVIASSGQTEVLIPGQGWRRAVVGRLIPAGSIVTTWVDADATIGVSGVEVQISPLTHLTIQTNDQLVETVLETGGLVVRVDRIHPARIVVVMPAQEYRIEASNAQFAIDRRAIVVSQGEVRVSRSRSPEVVLEAPATYSLLLHSPRR
ncbi:MAG: hypothetical protein EA404_08795 [Spirochaetaceae bacterium]|nr:MAG: hypothetical protein EA404_08795 [Spirochaetaceae bacterium]